MNFSPVLSVDFAIAFVFALTYYRVDFGFPAGKAYMSVVLTVKLTRRKIYNRCSIALICVLLMTSSMQGMVLCNGEDGQVSLEPVSGVCCDNLDTGISSEEPTTSRKEAFSSSKDDCGPCVDTPIPVVLAKVFKKPNPVNPTIVVSITIAASTVGSYNFSEYHLRSELFASVNPCLTSLRTVILLI